GWGGVRWVGMLCTEAPMGLPRRRFLHLAAAACALPAASRIASAQSYPTRPIRLVIPFPPGGAFDVIGRPWADKMKSLLGTVVVENMAGGGGSLGAATVARARPDGYTFFVGGARTPVSPAEPQNPPLCTSRPAVVQSGAGLGAGLEHCALGLRARDPSKSSRPKPGGIRCSCQSRSGQAVVRPRRNRLARSPDRRAAESFVGHRHRGGTLSRSGSGTCRYGQRAGLDGGRRGGRVGARTPPPRAAAPSPP